MNQPTLEEILKAQLARQWAEQVQQFDAEYELTGRNYSSDPMRAAAEYILSHAPAPTMAEVEWDDDKHYMAEAEHVREYTVIMLKPMRSEPRIKCLAFHDGDFCIVYSDPEDLTPTGRRYTPTQPKEN